MIYSHYLIAEEDSAAAQTELFYRIASARQSKEELLCFSYSQADEKNRSRAFSDAQRILKKLKLENKISLFVSYEHFRDNTTEMKYLFNKYPALEGEDALENPKYPYLLVRL